MVFSFLLFPLMKMVISRCQFLVKQAFFFMHIIFFHLYTTKIGALKNILAEQGRPWKSQFNPPKMVGWDGIGFWEGWAHF